VLQIPLIERDVGEHGWQLAVIDAARRSGWRVYWIPDWVWRLIAVWIKRHPYRAREWTPPGFPDLVCARRDPDTGRVRLVVAELKAHRGSVRGTQREWLDLLGAVPGVEAYVWKPKDWAEAARILGAGQPQTSDL